MSSSVITFYNSGEQQCCAAAALPPTARESSIRRPNAFILLNVHSKRLDASFRHKQRMIAAYVVVGRFNPPTASLLPAAAGY
jgi:hypothetical protein